jgi:hypothetical protein
MNGRTGARRDHVNIVALDQWSGYRDVCVESSRAGMGIFMA